MYLRKARSINGITKVRILNHDGLALQVVCDGVTRCRR